MQISRRIIFIAASLACSVLVATAARAELPPGEYEKMLKEAQEVLDLKVTKVEVNPPQTQTNMLHYWIDATVEGVERSKNGLKTGDTIRFKTYIFANPMPGPMPPPKLNVGWTGRVYLNAPREGSVYELAAYGRSFVPQSAQGNLPAPGITGPGMPGPGLPGPGVGPGLQPAPDGPRLGVVARSIPGGGLEVLSIGRKTLADKLGLRPGDRVLELNGTPVSEVGDVGRALGKQADKLDVKLTREGETFELSLKR